ncbi:MAG TPA: response regulator transcription factor [Armatimonadota bacterium]
MRSTTDIAVVTERERQEPMRPLLQQLERIGFDVHVLHRVSYQFTGRIPTPQVVLVDVTCREFQASGSPPPGIRATWEYVPIVLLARASEIAQIRFGPDFQGFLALPITPQELEARIRFAQWKTQGAGGQAPREQMEVANLRMNLATYEVFVDDAQVELTFKEFELLKFFISHPRRTFSRPELLETVWDSDYYGGTRTVDVHVRRLRAKLGETIDNMIHTVRNVGYRFG